jgi:hypothetical protein
VVVSGSGETNATAAAAAAADTANAAAAAAADTGAAAAAVSTIVDKRSLSSLQWRRRTHTAAASPRRGKWRGTGRGLVAFGMVVVRCFLEELSTSNNGNLVGPFSRQLPNEFVNEHESI